MGENEEWKRWERRRMEKKEWIRKRGREEREADEKSFG